MDKGVIETNKYPLSLSYLIKSLYYAQSFGCSLIDFKPWTFL